MNTTILMLIAGAPLAMALKHESCATACAKAGGNA